MKLYSNLIEADTDKHLNFEEYIQSFQQSKQAHEDQVTYFSNLLFVGIVGDTTLSKHSHLDKLTL